MNTGLIADIVIFGLIVLLIIANTLYGSCLLIRWIWKKVKTWKRNIK